MLRRCVCSPSTNLSIRCSRCRVAPSAGRGECSMRSRLGFCVMAEQFRMCQRGIVAPLGSHRAASRWLSGLVGEADRIAGPATSTGPSAWARHTAIRHRKVARPYVGARQGGPDQSLSRNVESEPNNSRCPLGAAGGRLITSIRSCSTRKAGSGVGPRTWPSLSHRRCHQP